MKKQDLNQKILQLTQTCRTNTATVVRKNNEINPSLMKVEKAGASLGKVGPN